MYHPPQRGRQSSADFPQAMGRTQMAEEHGHELIPASEAFHPSFRIQVPRRRPKPVPINQIKDLRKTACNLYHGLPPVCVLGGLSRQLGRFFVSTILNQTGGFTNFSKSYFGQE